MSKPEPSAYDRLALLRDQLIEVFITEAQPDKWPAGDKTAAERGDRFWMKRNAEATGRLAVRAFQLHALTSFLPAGQSPTADDADTIEAEAKKLEQMGIRLLSRHKASRSR